MRSPCLSFILAAILWGILAPTPSYAAGKRDRTKPTLQAGPTTASCIRKLKSHCPSNEKKRPTPERLACYKGLIAPDKELSECAPLVDSYLGRYAARLSTVKGNKPSVAQKAMQAALLFFGAIFVLSLLGLLFLPQLLKKADYEPWRGLVPFYNLMMLHRLAGTPLWWAFANLTPAVIIFWPRTCMALAEAFGQEERLGFVLALVPFIYLPYFAYSSSVHYEGRGDLPDIGLDAPLF